MAFLESLGRSRAITGGLRAISDLKTTQLDREIALGRETRAERAFEFEAEKIEVEKQRRLQPVNINLHPMFQAFSPEGQKRILEDLRSRGAIDAEGIGELGGLEDYVKEIESTTGLFELIMKPEVINRERQVLALIDKLKEEQGKDKPNPKMIQQIQTQIQQGAGAAAITRGNYEKAWKILKTEETKLTKQQESDIRLQREKDIFTFKQEADVGKGEKKFEKIETINFLVEKGIAKDFNEAFRMSRQLGTKSKRQFLIEARLKLEGNQFLDSKDIEARMTDIEAFADDLFNSKETKVKQLDRATAMEILREAGGDKNKARAIAKKRGFRF